MREMRSQQPGYWEFRHSDVGTYLYFNCPCGCPWTDAIPLYPKGTPKPHDHAWEWDGNEEAPTLAPSLRRNTACHFHGYLEAGVWRSAGDGAPLSPNVFRAGMIPLKLYDLSESIVMPDNPATDDEPITATPEAAHAHIWAAEPTGDDPHRYVCTTCGEEKSEPPTA